MSTKVLMSVEEYLRPSFEGPDCEYLDGEILERKDPAGALADVLHTENPSIEIPLDRAFDLNA